MTMANVDCARIVSAEERRRCEQRHARLMFGVALPFCLAFAAITRFLPRAVRETIPGFDGRHSLLREAKNAASSCIPFAFR